MRHVLFVKTAISGEAIDVHDGAVALDVKVTAPGKAVVAWLVRIDDLAPTTNLKAPTAKVRSRRGRA